MEQFLTRAGICYNLKVSPYKYTFVTQSQEITLHFSSKFHLNKYRELLENHSDTLSQSLSNRFNFKIEAQLLAKLSLYIKCENRGFYIHFINNNGSEGDISCQDNLILDGEKVILLNCVE